MEQIRKVFNSIIKGIDEKERTLTALVSTAGQDRMDDILEPSGADLKNFKKNPIVLWAHDYGMPPIAKALWVKKTADGILSKMKFANTDFASEIFDLYKEGFMNAFSVGFIPKDSEPVDKDKDDFFGGRRFTKWELLEYSAVPVPANPEALTLAVQKGIITEDRKSAIAKMIELQEELSKEKEGDPDEEDNEENEDDEKDMDSEFDGSRKKDDDSLEQKGKNAGLEDLLGDLTLKEEEIACLKKEISDLRYKLYLNVSKKQEHKPGITVDNLADRFAEIVDGAIRQAQGKVS